MASCATCGTFFLFGGERIGDYLFCSLKCRDQGYLLIAALDIPPETIEAATEQIRQNDCPKCAGPGPLGVYHSHTIYSVIFVSSFQSTPNFCCASCGKKAQAIALAKCLVLGWWSAPGLIMTPIQIIRNLTDILLDSHDENAFQNIVRAMLGSQEVALRQQKIDDLNRYEQNAEDSPHDRPKDPTVDTSFRAIDQNFREK